MVVRYTSIRLLMEPDVIRGEFYTHLAPSGAGDGDTYWGLSHQCLDAFAIQQSFTDKSIS
ncbi:MAG TPA: hypothetical protein VJV05_05065 [Pyrinomonadaceae bacterium]|nr:hypothetical protein [Pyrinomonadaceae bacterium]